MHEELKLRLLSESGPLFRELVSRVREYLTRRVEPESEHPLEPAP